jgi:hypothetical protein
MRQVAALYVHRDSIYKTMPGVECWDEDRDSYTYDHVMPVVAHPPCRLWGKLSHMSTADPIERLTGLHAIGVMMRCGGVIEHPASSRIWHWVKECDDGKTWLTTIRLFDFAFPCEKPTTLAIRGCEPADWPDMPLRLEMITHRIGNGRSGLIELSGKSHARSQTPQLMAEWMVNVARRCVP